MADGIGDADPEHVPSASPPPARPQLVAGQGRPGPLQLEGIQTPQVSVEKRGPREISVGKPVRYEIIVRNIGTRRKGGTRSRRQTGTRRRQA